MRSSLEDSFSGLRGLNCGTADRAPSIYYDDVRRVRARVFCRRTRHSAVAAAGEAVELGDHAGTDGPTTGQARVACPVPPRPGSLRHDLAPWTAGTTPDSVVRRYSGCPLLA